ncbi:MAG: fibronectin type III domain-containing protein, partial [Bacteroidales bacterium]|nr:fibronectin type III domain-containing protein [Bacteroidales bacterium]
MSAQSITVANGTTTNQYLPFYGLWLDASQHNQFVYPESMLTDLVGETITGLTFYFSSTPSNAWSSTCTIKMGTTTSSSLSNGFDPAATTVVYTGNIPINGNTITLMLSTAFTYTGGNLLLDINTIAGNYSSANFYGIYQSGAGICSYNGSSYVEDFVPKTTILYGNCVPPANTIVSNITQNSATLSWGVGGSESSWELYIANTPVNLDTVTWTTVTDTTYDFLDLNAGTQYTIYIRSDCGGEYSFPASIPFRTECGAMSLPFVEDFEGFADYEQPDCWEYLNEYTSYNGSYPYINNYASYAHNSAKSLMFNYNYNSTSTGYQLAILPLFNEDLTNLQISLYSRREGVNSGTFYIGYITDPNEDSTFVTVFSVTSNEMGDDDFHRHVVNFSDAQINPGDTAYIALGYYCGSNWYWYVDDITVDLIPACSEPSALTVSDINPTTATVSWVPGTATSFNLYYKKNGDADYTEVLSLTDTAYLLENLSPSTSYQWYVAAICDDGTLVNSEVKSFFTACGALSALPYFDDFENGPANSDLPLCWTRGNEYSGYPYLYEYSSHSGLKDLYFYYTNSVSLPPIDTNEIDIRQTVISFYAFADYEGTALQVGVMTNPNLYSTFVPVGNPIILTTSYQQYEVTLANYTGNGTYIAFRNPEEWKSLYLDDVMLDFLPDCSRPDAVWAQQVDTASATIEWNSTDNQSAWEIVYGLQGFTINEDDVQVVSTASYTIDNLTSNTAYDVYVRTSCGSESSNWSTVLTFTTLPGSPAMVPYLCDFEDTTENNAWTLLNQSQTNQWYIGTAVAADSSDYSMYISSDTGATNTYDISSSSVVWAYRDIQFSDADEFELSFDWKGDGESNYDYLRVFLSGPSPVSPGDMTVPAAAIQLGQFNQSPTWTHASYTLGSAYKNSTRRLYFMWRNDSNAGTNPPIAVDNISIIGVECAQPNAIMLVSSDTTTATLTITPSNPNQAEWEVLYGTSDSTMTATNVTSTTFTLENLTPGNEYVVYVRTLCDNGDTSASVSLSFATECTYITTIPQTWDFESNNTAGTSDYPMTACWEKGVSSSTYPYVYSYEAHEGSNSLYFYNYTPNLAILPIIDTNILPINTLQLSFYAKATSLNYYDAKFIVGVISDIYDPSSFVPVDTLELTENYPINNPYVVYFNNYTGNGNRIAIKNHSDDTYAYNALFIDDVTLDALPSCMPISNLQVVEYDQSSITLSWTEGSMEPSWNVEYKEASDTVWTSMTAASSPFTITGLTGATLYNIRVQSDCGGGDVSPWSYITGNTIICDSASQCSYTINMMDSYGDGWTGGTLTVKQNGIPVAEFTLDDGYSSSVQVTLCDATLTSLEWTDGSFSDEASFTVADPSGVVIYTSPTMNAYSTYSFISDCLLSACSPTSVPTVSNIGMSSVTVDWTSNGTETAWNVEYKLTTDNTWTVIPVTTHPYNLTGLTGGTSYDVRVQADCGSGEVSSYRQASFMTNYCEVTDQCTYTFVLGDAYGDGWNGSYMTMVQNGNTIANIEAADHGLSNTQTYDTVMVSLCDNQSITLNWQSVGMYDYEASIYVYGPDGTLVMSQVDFGSYTPFTFTTDCSGSGPATCDAPTGLAV